MAKRIGTLVAGLVLAAVLITPALASQGFEGKTTIHGACKAVEVQHGDLRVQCQNGAQGARAVIRYRPAPGDQQQPVCVCTGTFRVYDRNPVVVIVVNGDATIQAVRYN